MADPRKITRPASINETLLDRSIRHAVYLVRLGSAEAHIVAQAMPQVRQAVTAAIAPLLAQLDMANPGSVTNEMLIARAAEVGAEAASIQLQQISGRSTQRLGEIVQQEVEYERRLFTRILPIERQFSVPSEQLVSSLMSTEPIGGRTLQAWFTEMPLQTRTAINEQLRQGMLAGESINDMLRRVRGRREVGFRDGIIGRLGNNAQTIVRSGVMAASNAARQSFHTANKDLLKGHSWVLTLDDRTCARCAAGEAGNPYPVGSPPNLPAHPGCRCVTAPITKSWEELGLDIADVDPGTRASMDGQVPDSMTYPGWLSGQPESVQKDILGPARFEAYQKGVPVTSFADTGRMLNLEEIRAMEPDLFQ